MIFTARQLEELHRGNGHVTLPYRARLTPLAQDWLRQKKLAIGYADVEVKPVSPVHSDRSRRLQFRGPFVLVVRWPVWAGKSGLDGAVEGIELERAWNRQRREPTRSRDQERSQTKSKANRLSGAILLVKTGAEAIVYANRCPSLRAVLGTCIDAVEQGIQQVAANVLVIEHPYKTLSQVKNLVGRFRAGTSAS